MLPWPVLLALASAPEPLELVILPPEPQAGIKPDVAMQIWKSLAAEVEKSKDKLGVSLKLQKDAETALAGPARDQAWECKGEVPCLVDLGTTMGAALILAGSVEKEAVAFMVIDVRGAKKVVNAKSGKKLASAGWQRQHKVSMGGVLSGLEQWRNAPPKVDPPAPKLDPSVVEIRLSPAELKEVRDLTIDGLPIPRAADGGLTWSGVPGRHVVSATRHDGLKAFHDLTLEGGTSLALSLVFGAPPPPPPPPAPIAVAPAPQVAEPPPPPPRDDRDPTGAWWFWVAIGGAVVAGGTTAALLALGPKGGPSSESATGSITGSY